MCTYIPLKIEYNSINDSFETFIIKGISTCQETSYDNFATNVNFYYKGTFCLSPSHFMEHRADDEERKCFELL